MPHLLHDRYMLLDGDRACDLATGAEVRLSALATSEPGEGDASLRPVFEALDHGRDGHPRWVVAQARSHRHATATIERVAAAAVQRGFVAISIELYLRCREMLEAELRDRTLFLAGGFGGDPARAHAALLDASAFSPRPHLLLTFQLASPAGHSSFVREARAAYAGSDPGDGATQPLESGRHRGLTPDVARLMARAARAPEFAAAGRHAAAERLLRDVVAALSRRDAFAQASRLAITLGRLLHERGRSSAACAAFGEAAKLAQGASNGLLEARLWQASARVESAALADAEALCRAVLATGSISVSNRFWARAVLAEALFWQGRIDEAPDVEADGEIPADLDPLVVAQAHAIAARVRLAKGQAFEAGQRVEQLKALAARVEDPLVRIAAHGMDLEVLAAAGDLDRAQQILREVLDVARVARSPFRAAWARIAWVDALRRANRWDDANRQLARLQRIMRVAPMLLRREIERRATAPAPSLAAFIPGAAVHRPSSLSVALVRVAQDDDDDRGAIVRLLERLGAELHTSRVDLLSADAGPVSTAFSVGQGLPTTLGARVLEAAFAIGPEAPNGGNELGVPVRFGARVIGAIVCRWPVDRTIPGDASELLELTAAIAAPRLDALLTVTRDAANASISVPELVGVSDAMADVRKAIVRAATAPFAVLIEGESGVGKELAARAVHHLGPRRERRFCDVNCAALPEDLLESELFGHARGAFSGAVADRAGLFEDADGGTLFLDEVADLSPRAQAKLLRAIQQQEVRRIGESFSRTVDVRLVAAANRDMREEAAAGRFRQDLLYRLDVIRIRIPPLRERPEDIPALARQCWQAAAARVGSRAELSAAILADLARYHWPGNVRELQNVIASLAVGTPARGRLRPASLPAAISAGTSVSSGRLAEAREQFERRFIEVALARAGGSRARAARSLGVSRQGLLKILVRLGVERPPAAPGGDAP